MKLTVLPKSTETFTSHPSARKSKKSSEEISREKSNSTNSVSSDCTGNFFRLNCRIPADDGTEPFSRPLLRQEKNEKAPCLVSHILRRNKFRFVRQGEKQKK